MKIEEFPVEVQGYAYARIKRMESEGIVGYEPSISILGGFYFVNLMKITDLTLALDDIKNAERYIYAADLDLLDDGKCRIWLRLGELNV